MIEEWKMQEVGGGAEKRHAWFNQVQNKVSELLHKLSCVKGNLSQSDQKKQSELDRLSSLQKCYSKQHNKDMSALERRQRKTMEQSAARIEAMKKAKSHFHIEQSGDNWQIYDNYLNPRPK